MAALAAPARAAEPVNTPLPVPTSSTCRGRRARSAMVGTANSKRLGVE